MEKKEEKEINLNVGVQQHEVLSFASYSILHDGVHEARDGEIFLAAASSQKSQEEEVRGGEEEGSMKVKKEGVLLEM